MASHIGLDVQFAAEETDTHESGTERDGESLHALPRACV